MFKDKKGQLDMEVIGTPTFFILAAIGYGAFAFMLIILKGMGSSDIMPWWVKIVTALVIPVAAYIFTLVNS